VIKDYYNTIDKSGYAEFKEKGSKFLAYTFCMKSPDEFTSHLQNLRKEHPKAAHHCYAYRIGFDGSNFRTGDDGEPTGTAGKPILGQIDSQELTNALVIVVRYFGGTLLGTSGLYNAYKYAAALALHCSGIICKPVEIIYTLEFNYQLIDNVMRILKKYNCSLIQKEIQLFCHLETGIPKINQVRVLQELENLPDLVIKMIS
jgi:uncharacterized YigZ family protein